MNIYYITILSLLILGYYLCEIKKSNRNIILFLAIASVALIVISSLRYSIGFDYYSYKEIFLSTANIEFWDIAKNFESYPGYAYLNKIVSYFTDNYTIFLFIFNSIIMLIVSPMIYKYSKYPWISIFIYITFHFFAQSMNLYRMALAGMIFLLAYPCIIHKKPIVYLVVVLIGTSIHKSMFIMLPMYYLLKIKSNIKIYALVGIIAVIFYSYSDKIIEFISQYIYSGYYRYLSTRYGQGNGIQYTAIHIIYFLTAIFFRKKLLAANEKNNILINSAFYTLIINMFITKHFIIERFSIYVFPLSMILIPEIIDICKNSGKVKHYVSIAIVLAVGLIYFQFGINEGFHNVYPYIGTFYQHFMRVINKLTGII